MAPTSADVLSRLEKLHPKVIDLSLGRVLRLLTDLGAPQDRLGRVVHVAGTNGKGSVVAFLRAILQAHGLRVHVFTSPHLVRFHERIVVAGREIDEKALVTALRECEEINAGKPITFFEITAAAALLAFSRAEADLTLLETGLGGRLDATNVVARPELTVLTPIDMDHQAFLGDSLTKIAAEKVGIMRPNVPCLSARQHQEAADVIRSKAATLDVPVAWESVDWQVRAEAGGTVYTSRSGSLRLPAPGLKGRFQYGNAGLAVACAELLLADALVPAAIARGMAEVRWPGRLQFLRCGPLPHLLPQGWELWLDGGHNPAAALALADELESWQERPNHLVVGMLRTKDAAEFLARVGSRCRCIMAVAIPDSTASLSAEELSDIGRSTGVAVQPARGIADALVRLARRNPEVPARVLICGSLYLAGAALRLNEQNVA